MSYYSWTEFHKLIMNRNKLNLIFLDLMCGLEVKAGITEFVKKFVSQGRKKENIHQLRYNFKSDCTRSYFSLGSFI